MLKGLVTSGPIGPVTRGATWDDPERFLFDLVRPLSWSGPVD